MTAVIQQIIYWPFAHEATFWSLIAVFLAGIAIGSGRDGRWRTWFE